MRFEMRFFSVLGVIFLVGTFHNVAYAYTSFISQRSVGSYESTGIFYELFKEKEKIFYLRANPEHIAREKSPFKNHYVSITYKLKLPPADPNEFKIAYEPFAFLQEKHS